MKYLVVFEVYASTTVEVEAGSEEEARDLANEKAYCPSVCQYCANEVEISDIGDITEVSLLV